MGRSSSRKTARRAARKQSPGVWVTAGELQARQRWLFGQEVIAESIYLDYAEHGDPEVREALDAWEDLIAHLPPGLEVSACHHAFLLELCRVQALDEAEWASQA